jgi:hypothetical protein
VHDVGCGLGADLVALATASNTPSRPRWSINPCVVAERLVASATR